MKRRKCRYVDQRDIEACIGQLQAIIDGLRSGSMALDEDEQSVLLRPAGLLDFEVRVEQLERKETLRVELSWKLAQRGADSKAPASGPRPVQDEAVWEGPITAWPKPARAALLARDAEPSLVEPSLAAPSLVEPPLAEPSPAEVSSIALSAFDAADGSLEEEISADELLVDDFLAEELPAAPAPGAVALAEDVALDSSVVACSCALRSGEDPISGWPPPRSVVAEYHQLYAEACTVGSDGLWHLDRDQLVQSLARAGVDPLTQQELYSSALQADLDRTSWFSARVVAALERASQRPLAEAG